MRDAICFAKYGWRCGGKYDERLEGLKGLKPLIEKANVVNELEATLSGALRGRVLRNLIESGVEFCWDGTGFDDINCPCGDLSKGVQLAQRELCDCFCGMIDRFHTLW